MGCGERGVPYSPLGTEKFFEFSSKKCRVLGISTAILYLWSETGTGGGESTPGG